MADDPGNPDASSRPAEAEQSAGEGVRNWRTVWQLPVLIAAAGLVVAGTVTMVLRSPKPDFDGLLGRAETMVVKEHYREALDELNQRLRPWYDSGTLSSEQMQRFHLLRARAVYLGERELGLQLPENARSVVEEYAEAARYAAGGSLAEPRDIYFLAESHITLGMYERALDLARSIESSKKSGSDQALWAETGLPRIYRRIVERQLREPVPESELILRLLNDFLREGAPSAEDRAWALARQSEILIRTGDHDAAISRLLRTMPALLSDLGPEQTGELYLLLGRAYIETGALVEAGRQLRTGIESLLDTDERWARAMVLLARVDEATGHPAEDALADARQRYLTVVARFDGSDERLAALLGLAEIESALGYDDSSLTAYGQLVDVLLDGRMHPDATPKIVTSSLLARWRSKFESGEVDAALRFAKLAQRLTRGTGATPTSTPPEVLLAIGRTYRELADRYFPDRGEIIAGGESRLQRIKDLDAASRQSVRASFASAGRYYKMHADAVGIADNEAFGESLWQAAVAQDMAGDIDASIPLYSDYVKYFPNDPRRAEARFRLARAYQGRGDYKVAAEHFQGLINDGRSASVRARGGAEADPGAAGVGPYADLSVVPLAQVLLLLGDPEQESTAEALLSDVVSGRIGGLNTPQFREGLIELGLLLQRRGDYAGAIQRLEEAVQRFPQHPRVESVRFQLAEAHRQDAMAIRRTLAEAMPEHRKQMLQQARIDRLQRAEELYEQVRRALEMREPGRRSRLEEVQLRNAYFYLGDCAFELGSYDTAIQRYDAARERFPGDPATLVAMVQIVNAYVEQGDMARAVTANERARRFYQSLPQSAWTDPDLPMSRDDWQRWLDSMTALRPVRSQEERTAGVEERPR